MSKIDRSKIRKLILKEFKMLGMQDMGTAGFGVMGTNPRGCDSCGMSPCGCDEYQEPAGLSTMMPSGDNVSKDEKSHKSSVSKEDCCAAIMCLVECCSCPVTRQVIMECCEDLLSGNYNR
jgi:hypothetical protein